MNLLLMANRGLPKKGLVALYDMGKQIQLGNTGQTLVDFSGRGNNAQLGSAAGADTNDPAYSGQGLTFGTDDYCKSSSPVFDDMAQFTCITVCKANSLGGSSAGRLFNKGGAMELMVAGGNALRYYQGLATSAGDWKSQLTFSLSTPFVNAISYNRVTPDTPPTIRINNSKSAITTTATGVGLANSDAPVDLLIGNSDTAARYFDGTIYLQAWYNRILSDTEYMQAYSYLKRLMSSRGITI